MPILKREDGTQFALHAYRELLQPEKASVLRNELRLLAQNHGEYLRLYKLPSGQYEAVFSRDPGYLLGEAVWQYFGKPADLIYCEALPEGNFAVVVVVRGGSVYLDAKISYSNLADEFASLLGTDQYDIYIYGDVPISETKQRGKFSFDSSQVKSFTRLDQPVIKNLLINASLQLQPLDFALRSLKIAIKPLYIMTAIGAALLLLILWHVYHRIISRPAAAPTPTITTTQAPVDPYAGYKSALTSPAPDKQINELATLIATTYNPPGWQSTAVTFDGSNYTIQLTSLGGNVTLINRWADTHNLRMTLSQQGAFLTADSIVNNRVTPDTIYPLNQVLYFVIDTMNQVLPQRSITLGEITNIANYKTTTIGIQLNGVSPSVLSLIGKRLHNLPVKLVSSQVTIEQGLLSGVIQLNILGN